VSTESVSHEYYLVNARDRYSALKRLSDANPDIFSVIFCRTKRDTQKVAEQLITDGYNAAALHGDLSQNQRDIVMKSFRSRQIQMLVATDVAARGIDVSEISHVINFDMPDTVDAYTHRIGRTGRAEETGEAFTFTTPDDEGMVRDIERLLGERLDRRRLDGFDYNAPVAAATEQAAPRPAARQQSQGGNGAAKSQANGSAGGNRGRNRNRNRNRNSGRNQSSGNGRSQA
jgi:ATP-dependent RNA helicase DeaD